PASTLQWPPSRSKGLFRAGRRTARTFGGCEYSWAREINTDTRVIQKQCPPRLFLFRLPDTAVAQTTKTASKSEFGSGTWRNANSAAFCKPPLPDGTNVSIKAPVVPLNRSILPLAVAISLLILTYRL